MPTRCFIAVYRRPDKTRPTLIPHTTLHAAKVTLKILIHRTASDYGHDMPLFRGLGYGIQLSEFHRIAGEQRVTAEVICVEASDIVVRWLGGMLDRPLKLRPKQNWPMLPKETHQTIYDEIMSLPRLPAIVRAADRFEQRRQEAKSGAWRIR